MSENITLQNISTIDWGALVFKIAQSNNFEDWFADFSVAELNSFIEQLKDSNYGQSGYYHHECKNCGGFWFFKTRTEAKFFKHFHDATGCAVDIYFKESSPNKNAFLTSRAIGENINKPMLDFLGKLLTDKTGVTDDIETDVHREPAI